MCSSSVNFAGLSDAESFDAQLIEQRGKLKNTIGFNWMEFTRKAIFFWGKDTVLQLSCGSKTSLTKNHRQMWIPPGYAYGFCVISDVADFQYKCTDFYFPVDEGGLSWNDPEVGIDWPTGGRALSEKDQKLPILAQIRAKGGV